MDNLGFLLAGYGITILTLAGYFATLRGRARRAAARAERMNAGR